MNRLPVVIASLLAASVHAQDLNQLRRQLADKEAEVRQLRQRIDTLERELTPRRVPAPTRTAAPEDEDGDSNRALERALVRERGLLLSARTVEVEPNFVYSHLAIDGLRRDAYGPGLAIRAGLPARWQLEAGVPYVWERRESGGTVSRAHGEGDAYVAASRQLLTERGSLPSLIGTLSWQFSNGRNTLFDAGQPVALGSGFDGVSASLTALKRTDPLVFFGSYAFTHLRPARKGVGEVDLGNSHALRFGVALATSPTTSLRTAFSLRTFERARIGGLAVPGTDESVGLLELGASAVLSPSTAIDVLVGAGVTRAAPDFRIGVALPIRF
ncbi:MAG: hypothetical protein NBV65_05690 [Burkholderiaceae bacterium]|nr:hypothetical protein [Burkholderiaceae bacterium]